MKDNLRLIELRLALILNNIVNLEDKEQINNVLRLLKCVATFQDKGNNEVFDNILINSINEKLLGADKKELSLMLQVFYTGKMRYIKKLRLNVNELSSSFYDIKTYVTSNYINSLQPKYASLTIYKHVCEQVANFSDNFTFIKRTPKHNYNDNSRFMEFKLFHIYQCLCKYFKDTTITRLFITELCNAFSIKSEIIFDIVSNPNIILKGFENKITYNVKLTKELVNYGYLEGFKLYEIATLLLNKPVTFLSNRSIKMNAAYNETNNPEYFNKEYIPTIITNDDYKDNVTKFINIFDWFISDEY
jgi:hypothetical protein